MGVAQLDAALRAVGLAQFTLMQGIHREVSRLTALILEGSPPGPGGRGSRRGPQGDPVPAPEPPAPTAAVGISSSSGDGGGGGKGAGSAEQARAAAAGAAGPGASRQEAPGESVPGAKGRPPSAPTPSRSFKLGDYQLKQLRNGDLYRVSGVAQHYDIMKGWELCGRQP